MSIPAIKNASLYPGVVDVRGNNSLGYTPKLGMDMPMPMPKWPVVLDVSHWQGNVNWGKVMNRSLWKPDTELSAVILKLTQGLTEVDPKFEQYISDIKKVPYYTGDIGVYHYLTQKDSCTKQAEFFINTLWQAVGKHGLNPFAIALDVELPDAKATWPGLTECIMNYSKVMNVAASAHLFPPSRGRSRFTIYANPSTWSLFDESKCKNITINGMRQNLWAAGYSNLPPSFKCWKNDWWLWQFGNNYSWPGIMDSRVDASVFNPSTRDSTVSTRNPFGFFNRTQSSVELAALTRGQSHRNDSRLRLRH